MEPSIQKAGNFDAQVTMGTYLGRILVGGKMDESRILPAPKRCTYGCFQKWG